MENWKTGKIFANSLSVYNQIYEIVLYTELKFR